MTKWTEERRQKQAEAIRRHKPWLKSTGPKTTQGKRRSRMNAMKEGGRTEKMRNLKRVLQRHEAFMRAIKKAHVTETRYDRLANELLKSHDKSVN